MSTTTEVPRIPLGDGRTIPQIGFGVYKIPPESTAETVATAIELGYRHIDTATLYGNEREVGEGIRSTGIDRDAVFITTKVWQDSHGFDETLRAFERSKRLLGLDEVDLYLIHWPAPAQDRFVDTWRALVRLHDEGCARSIGVANFTERHLERLIDETGTAPAVNQVELHPEFAQNALREFHRRHGIVTEAWSPLARGGAVELPMVRAIAAAQQRTPAQIVLRWHLQHGIVVIPKSQQPDRIAENLDILDFELDDAQMHAIDALDTGRRRWKDPERFG